MQLSSRVLVCEALTWTVCSLSSPVFWSVLFVVHLFSSGFAGLYELDSVLRFLVVGVASELYPSIFILFHFPLVVGLSFVGQNLEF